jgi:hypothetical protein
LPGKHEYADKWVDSHRDLLWVLDEMRWTDFLWVAKRPKRLESSVNRLVGFIPSVSTLNEKPIMSPVKPLGAGASSPRIPAALFWNPCLFERSLFNNHYIPKINLMFSPACWCSTRPLTVNGIAVPQCLESDSEGLGANLP